MNYWQGTRIRLRAVEPADAEIFNQWNRDSERARNLDFVWPPTSRASMDAWAQAESLKHLGNDQFRWIIETLQSTPVGSIDTHSCNPRCGTFGYGIDIAPEHRRKGYAGEAIRLVLRYYFEELRYQKVTVPVHSYNAASIRLHERLYFKLEGTHRRMGFTRGSYFDVLWYGMTVDEFQSIS